MRGRRPALMRWAFDALPLWMYDALARTCCFLVGHEPERDMCGKPEHDYCAWCLKPQPGRARA